MWTGWKPSKGGGGAPGGPREEAAHHPMCAVLYICRRQSNSLYRPKPNTSNPPYNSVTTDVETGSKVIEHRGGETLREDVNEL
jgi:hypothetical protein